MSQQTPPDRVWYAAYGSNLLAERFHHYLAGGQYGPSGRAHLGARDASLPAGWKTLEVPHQLRFGHESSRWGGGVAFLDPRVGSGHAVLRCWDITAQQFSDVAAQENGLRPGQLEIDVDAVVAAGTAEVTQRWYGTALHLGELDGRPVVTFTCGSPPEPTSPGDPYLEVIVSGLRESRALDGADIAAYLHCCPGVSQGWTFADLTRLIEGHARPLPTALARLRMDDFDYVLPSDVVAQTPAEPRDAARLLIDRGPTEEPLHRRVSDLTELLGPGDLLVVNETKVIPARLLLKKETGGAAEVLLLEPDGVGGWIALVKPGRRLRPGTVLRSERDVNVVVRVGDGLPDGRRTVTVEAAGRPILGPENADLLTVAGEAPLPPYIRAGHTDADRYQTVYAATPGSVAAPTAGLHFTPDLLARLEERGVRRATVDLVVGLDTFRPVMVDDPDDHVMHSERYSVPEATWQACLAADRVVAVGTTTVRSLESAARFGLTGRTDLFLRRGSTFEVVDAMITNFHLPRSTLLLMIDAFVGPRWRDLYTSAMADGYRFLSFGDAMFLQRIGVDGWDSPGAR